MRRLNMLTPGAISEWTTKADEIGTALIYDMRRLRMSRAHRATFRRLVRDFDRILDERTEERRDEHDGEALDSAVDDLRMLAEEYVAPFCWIGMHDGDGACFGVWVNIYDAETESLKVDDTADVPKGYTGHVLHVNDHGNATLYRASRGRLRELWSVV